MVRAAGSAKGGERLKHNVRPGRPRAAEEPANGSEAAAKPLRQGGVRHLLLRHHGGEGGAGRRRRIEHHPFLASLERRWRGDRLA